MPVRKNFFKRRDMCAILCVRVVYFRKMRVSLFYKQAHLCNTRSIYIAYKTIEDACIHLRNSGIHDADNAARSISAICRRYRFSAKHSTFYIRVAIALTTARSKVFNVWQRRGLCRRLRAARNNLHNCAGPLVAIAFSAA